MIERRDPVSVGDGGAGVSRLLDATAMRDIAKGATFLGAGGGGALDNGLTLVGELEAAGKAEVTVVECSEMGDSDWAVSVAGVGSPMMFKVNPSGEPLFPEGPIVFRAMRKALAAEGRDARFLIPIEVGGLNTLIALWASAMEGVPVVDADGTGRAVPSFAALLFGVWDVPASPLVMAGMNLGSMDTITITMGNPKDSAALENIARHISMAHNGKDAVCTYPVNRSMIESFLVPGALTLQQKVGEALKNAKSLEEFSFALSALTKSRLAIVGKITKVERKVEAAHDLGRTVIQGLSGKPDDALIIEVKNENILARDAAGKVIGTCPDLMCYLDVDTMTPLSNADTAEGQTVAVFGAKAHENFYRTPRGFDSFKPFMVELGYEGGYVPFI